MLKIDDPFCNGCRIHACEVPAWVKARAYDMFERDRLREKSDALVKELRPDKGGSQDAMTRLSQVREQLKKYLGKS